MTPRRRVRTILFSALFLAWGLAVATGSAEPTSLSPTSDKSSPPRQTAQAAGQPEVERPRNARVLFVIKKDCPRCEDELARLRRPGGEFDKLKAVGWKIGTDAKNHIQIVDFETLGPWAERLSEREFPTVAGVDHEEIVRCFHSGCTTPLDKWTFSWIAKGIDERPAGSVPEAARVESTGHYPLRGNHWSIDEDWNPSREKVLGHLRGPVHGPQISARYEIETWSYEELRSLHDHLHEVEMGGVQFGGGTPRATPADQFSAARKAGGS
jgi:hypothetical protein